MEHLRSLRAGNNRLTDRSLVELCVSLPPQLRLLDLSGNKIGNRGAATLGRALARHETLEVLRLDGNPLSLSSVRHIVQGLAQNRTVMSVDMTRCGIDAAAGEFLARLITKNKTITQLSLSWNQLAGHGAAKMLLALQANAALRSLDLSWNALGSKAGLAAVQVRGSLPPRHHRFVEADTLLQALAQALGVNNTLLHLDLSHNMLLASHCNVLAAALAENHALCGLHMDGNEAQVDAKGFVAPSDSSVAMDPRSAHVFTRTIGMKVPDQIAWAPVSPRRGGGGGDGNDDAEVARTGSDCTPHPCPHRRRRPTAGFASSGAK